MQIWTVLWVWLFLLFHGHVNLWVVWSALWCLYEILVIFTLQEYKFSSFGVYKHVWGAHVWQLIFLNSDVCNSKSYPTKHHFGSIVSFILSQWHHLWFWLSYSGIYCPKLHCGNFVNMPYWSTRGFYWACHIEYTGCDFSSWL